MVPTPIRLPQLVTLFHALLSSAPGRLPVLDGSQTRLSAQVVGSLFYVRPWAEYRIRAHARMHVRAHTHTHTHTHTAHIQTRALTQARTHMYILYICMRAFIS